MPTLAALRGRVVMLFYWSSGCPVCLDQWPELRANAKGWLRHPFTLVAVNTDPTPGPWREHERLMVLLRTQAPNVLSLWQGELDPSLAAAGSLRRLPLTRVLDRQGREVSRVEGRVAPEAWDDVAALLP